MKKAVIFLGTVLSPLCLSWLSAPANDCDANGVDDALQIQGASNLDLNLNGVLDTCENLSADRATISLSAGGVQEMSIHINPSHQYSYYHGVGTTTGSAPGVQLGTLFFPLNYDGAGGYMAYTVSNPNSALLQQSRGYLDGVAQGKMYFRIPPGTDPGLAGIVVHHAVAVWIAPDYLLSGVTNYVSCELVP